MTWKELKDKISLMTEEEQRQEMHLKQNRDIWQDRMNSFGS